MSTATEDVLRHVIHDVVHQATHILKTHRAAYQRALEDSIFHPVAAPSPDASEVVGAADAILISEQGAEAEQEQPDHPEPGAVMLSETARGFHTTAPTHAFPSMPELFAVGDAPILQAHSVTDTLAAFVVRAVVMDPRNGYALDREFAKADVERLIAVGAGANAGLVCLIPCIWVQHMLGDWGGTLLMAWMIG